MKRSMLLVTLMAFTTGATCSSAATFLSPNDYLATSAFVSVPGPYTINTDSLQMTGPAGFSFAGVLSGGVAVFAFTNFSLDAGAGITTLGSRPVAILSQGDMAIAGNGIRALAGGGNGGEPAQRGTGPGGGYPGYSFFGGPGGGGGFGGVGGRGQFENPTFDFPGAGGPAYGDLSVALQGGSGGGGGKTNAGFQSAGGDGGGAIELAAIGQMLIAGSGVIADGLQGAPRDYNHTGGGGGSGGGIRVLADQILNTSILAARGGRGGDGVFENGGGGGGGRIYIQSGDGGFSNLGTVNVGGGLSPSDFFGTGTPGQPGIITIVQVPEPVASGPLLLMMAVLFRDFRRGGRRDMH